MKIRYVGPSVAVTIAATGQDVQRGGTVEVPDELGRSLCEQAVWKPTRKNPKAPTSAQKDKE